MAIAFDAVSTSVAWLGVTDVTWAHVCTGSDLALAVGVWHTDGNVTGVTYNGSATGAAEVFEFVYDGFGQQLAGWRILAPASGTHDIVVTLAASVSFIQCGAVSCTGVGGVRASPSDATGSSTTAAVTATTVSGDMCVDVVGINNTPTVDGSQTQRVNVDWNGFGNFGGMSNKAATTTSTAMQWTASSADWGINTIIFTPAGAGGTTRGGPFDGGTAFNGGRTFKGIIR